MKPVPAGTSRQRCLGIANAMKDLFHAEAAVADWEDEGGALGRADYALKLPADLDPSVNSVPSEPVAEESGRLGKSSAVGRARHRSSRPSNPGIGRFPISP